MLDDALELYDATVTPVSGVALSVDSTAVLFPQDFPKINVLTFLTKVSEVSADRVLNITLQYSLDGTNYIDGAFISYPIATMGYKKLQFGVDMLAASAARVTSNFKVRVHLASPSVASVDGWGNVQCWLSPSE